MPAFKETLSHTELILPLICFGMLLMGAFIFSYIYNSVRDRQYLTMIAMALGGTAFVFSESMILVVGGWLGDAAAGMRYNRLEQISALVFLFAVPLLLRDLLGLGPRWRAVNRVVIWAGVGLAVGLTVVAFAAPDLYLSITSHHPRWQVRQADYGRGLPGPLYMARDGLLFALILYALTCFVVDLVRHGRLRYLLPTFIGLLLVVYAAVVDILGAYSADSMVAFDPTARLRYSRFAVGVTLFILFSMGGSLRRFLDLARDTERANERAQREAEKNLKRNLFIRDVLKASTDTLAANTESLSESIARFTDNSREQASATEQISASIEESSTSVASVKENAERQLSGIGELTGTLSRLTASTAALSQTVSRSLSMIGQVSASASSGEEALRVMNDSMQRIRGSSSEITGIIGIINDISDRINLLALNAAIEAARAGDAGRGFAVVAGEIGKLAAATAESIKNINGLIRTNEQEISGGMQNIDVVVARLKAIIEDIGSIVAAITEMSARAEEQSRDNKVVEENTGLVEAGAQRITRAMNAQSLSIAGISRAIGSIRSLSQGNTERIEAITASSRALVEMMNALRDEIEKFSRQADGARQDAPPDAPARSRRLAAPRPAAAAES